MNNTRRLATIDDLLKGVPQFQCLEGCHDCCGPIAMSRLENRRIEDRAGRVDLNEHLDCSMLKDGKCSVYEIRPAICRVFGATEHPRLQCPHGKRPEKPMSAQDADALMGKVMELGHGMAKDLGGRMVQRLAAMGRFPGL